MYDLTPEEFERLEAIRGDAPVRWARWILNLAGVVSLLVGLATLIGFLVAPTEGTGLPSWFFQATAPLGCCFTGLPGVLALWAGSQLYDGKKAGWYLGVLMGGLLVPSICLPFGVVVLWALMRPQARQNFGV